MKSLLAVAALALGVSCVLTPRDACHERLIAEQGCCPFHAEECNVPPEAIEAACGEAQGDHEISLLDEDDESDDAPEESVDPRPE